MCDFYNEYKIREATKEEGVKALPLKRRKKTFFNLFFRRPINSRKGGGVKALMARSLREEENNAASLRGA